MSNSSFFWHDYETSGTDPRRDRPLQFAGLRTTLDLQPVGEPVCIFCKPARDVLPHPAACLITGITPQQAERDGIVEAAFAARVQEELGQPGTCGVGYNSLRFDDEFTRNLLYRNFHDPYEREWKDGNSRWDLIDLARMCYALRPQGVEWPRRFVDRTGKVSSNDDAPPPNVRIEVASFKLEDLAAANHLVHAKAHDALSDVQATIDFARLLRVRQPRLFEFYFALRRKQRVFELLDYVHRTPVLHVSSRYPAERGCLAMIVPLAAHPMLPNGVIACDLDVDPTPLLELDADEIADRVFTPRADLPDDIARVPLKTVHANKSPALAPLSALNGVDTARIGLDVERCKQHLRILQAAEDLPEKLRRVFNVPRDDSAQIDPDLAIYRGFASDADKRLFGAVRATPPAEWATRRFNFKDARFTELLFRYRARNWPQTLTAEESDRWEALRRERLTTVNDASLLTLEAYFDLIAQQRLLPNTSATQSILLDQLEAWGRAII
jgi:exodeoxyribonuclease I